MYIINSASYSLNTLLPKKFTPIIAPFVAIIIVISMDYSIGDIRGVNSASCNCVVFRLDDAGDLQDVPAQLEIMNLFIVKNQSLSVAVVMDSVGFIYPADLTSKLLEGFHKHLFELSLHGFHHLHYPSMSKKMQEKDLVLANNRMKTIFGNTTEIFTPPYSSFNNDTVGAMKNVGLKLISANLTTEHLFDKGKSIFFFDMENKNNNSNLDSLAESSRNLVHLPGTIYNVGQRVKFLPKIDSILSEVHNNLNEYGYSVIVLHPFGFNKGTGEACTGAKCFRHPLDKEKIDGLSNLIDALLNNNIKITTLREIAGMK